MKNDSVFLRILKPKKIAAIALAFAVAIPSAALAISVRAEAENLADVTAIEGMYASASVDTENADGAFQWNKSWQNTNEAPVGEGSSQWLALDFGKATTFQSMQINQYGRRLKQFSIQVSNDGANWITVYQGIDMVEPPASESWNNPEDYMTVSLPEAVTASHFRLMMEEVTAPTEPKVIIGQISLFNTTMTTTSTIISCDLADVSVNTELKASASVNADSADGAFQYNKSWQNSNEAPIGDGNAQWLSLDFGKKTKFNSIRMQQYGRRLKQFSLQGSDNGEKWTTFFQGTDATVPEATEKWGEYFTVVFEPVEYTQFRILMEDVTNPGEPKVIVGQISIFNSPGQNSSPEIAPLSFVSAEIAHGLAEDAYTASTFTQDEQNAAKAFDEYDWSPWMAQGGAQAVEPQWLMVNFGEKKAFTCVEFSQFRSRTAKFKMQFSDDGEQWEDAYYGQIAGAADSGDDTHYTVVFPEVTGQYFRMLFEETAIADGATIQSQPAIFDMKIYDKKPGAELSPEITKVVVKPVEKMEIAHGLPNASYVASTAQQNQEAPYAFDEDPESVWQAESTAQVTASQWLMVDLGEVKPLSKISFVQYGNRVKQFKLQTSEDPETEVWTDIYKGNVASAEDNGVKTEYTVVFPTVNTRYFRMLFLDMAGKTEDNAVPSMPAIFDMKIFREAEEAVTSEQIQEGLLSSEDSFKPAAPLHPERPDNIALGKGTDAYTSSSNMKDQLPSYAFDGIGGTNWQNSTAKFPDWLQVDLGEKQDVTGIWISQWSNRIKYFKIMISDDGTNWEEAFYGRVTDAIELTGSTELNIAFDPVQTRFVRLSIEDTVYDTPNKCYFTIPIYELEVYNDPEWTSGNNVINVNTEKPSEETLKALNDILDRIAALDPSQYTEKTYVALKAAYENALPYADGSKGNNTEVKELIDSLLAVEKELIPLSAYNDLRELRKEIIQLDGEKYHPDDWNNLMILCEYADMLLADENADTSEVAFYVKAIDIALASLRMADEEDLDYEYPINPQKEDEYIAEYEDGDASDTGNDDSSADESVNTGVTNYISLALVLSVLSLFAALLGLHTYKKQH